MSWSSKILLPQLSCASSRYHECRHPYVLPKLSLHLLEMIKPSYYTGKGGHHPPFHHFPGASVFSCLRQPVTLSPLVVNLADSCCSYRTNWAKKFEVALNRKWIVEQPHSLPCTAKWHCFDDTDNSGQSVAARCFFGGVFHSPWLHLLQISSSEEVGASTHRVILKFG